MTKQINKVNLSQIDKLAKSVIPDYYVDDNFLIRLSVRVNNRFSISVNKPFLPDDGFVMLVISGRVKVLANMLEYEFGKHTLTIFPPGSIIEIVDCSDDFDACTFSFKELPQPVNVITTCRLGAREWRRAMIYVRLMWNETLAQPLDYNVIEALQTAFFLSFQRVADARQYVKRHSLTRSEAIFHDFIDLVSQYGLQERKIQFYADRLCLSPSHLGATIKQTSGLSVMQWLNRRAIQKAKALLRYSDLTVWEISEQLNFANPSFFSKFFKNETGITPGEYRKA